ncbi:MAG: EthD family reductase [Bryobacteraceae bacterium]
MVIVSVLYPKTKESRFDIEYYLRTHIPLVKSRWSDMGLTSIDLIQRTAAISGGVPRYEVIGQLTFESTESLEKALSQHGGEILGDIPNFTDVQPIIQTGRSL